MVIYENGDYVLAKRTDDSGTIVKYVLYDENTKAVAAGSMSIDSEDLLPETYVSQIHDAYGSVSNYEACIKFFTPFWPDWDGTDALGDQVWTSLINSDRLDAGVIRRVHYGYVLFNLAKDDIITAVPSPVAAE